jgi:hypothetical protein
MISSRQEINDACDAFFKKRGMHVGMSWKAGQLKNYRENIMSRRSAPAALLVDNLGITARGAEWLDGWFYGTHPETTEDLGKALAWMALEFPAGLVLAKEVA